MSENTKTQEERNPIIAIGTVVVSMSVVFAGAREILPTGISQPIAVLTLGFVITAALIYYGHLSFNTAGLTWLSTSILVVILYLFLSQPARVSGQITDAIGNPISNLSLTLTNSSGIEQRTITNSEGRFEIRNVPEGPYYITVESKRIYSSEVASGWQRFSSTVSVGGIVTGTVITPIPVEGVASPNNSTNTNTSASQFGPVNLRLYYLWDEPLQNTLIGLFNEWSNQFSSGSTIVIQNFENFEALQNAFATGNAPHLIYSGPGDLPEYKNAGMIQPLSNLIDFSVYNSTYLLDGDIYGVPTHDGNHLMLIYNRTLIPNPPQSFDELITLAHTFQGTNIQGFAYNITSSYWLLPFVYGFGGSIFDADGNFSLNSQGWIDAFEFVYNLKVNEGILMPSSCDYDCISEGFMQGTIAMILNGDWVLSAYADTQQSPSLGEENLGLASLPILPNGQRPTPIGDGRLISITTDTTGAELEAALAFITWLTTDKPAILARTIETYRLPTLRSANQWVELTSHLILLESKAALETTVPLPMNISLHCLWGAVDVALVDLLNSSITPEQAAEQAQEAAETCSAD